NMMADSMTGLVGEVQGQRERLETVINSIDDGIVVLDAQRRIVAANDAFLERTGYDRLRVLGRSCAEAGANACSGAEDCPTVACLGAGGPQVRVLERRKLDGS